MATLKEIAEQLAHQRIVQYGQPVTEVIDPNPHWPEHEFYSQAPEETPYQVWNKPVMEHRWRVPQEQIQQALENLLQGRVGVYSPYLPQEEAKITYIPPIVDDADIDIYNRVQEEVKQEIRENIHRYFEQVQRDYPPEPRVGTT